LGSAELDSLGCDCALADWQNVNAATTTNAAANENLLKQNLQKLMLLPLRLELLAKLSLAKFKDDAHHFIGF
jgi:hypothetical protein